MGVSAARKDLEAARSSLVKAESLLARLEEKREALAMGIPNIEGEIAAARAGADQALKRYIADDLGEDQLSAARRKASDLVVKKCDQEDLVEAMKKEVTKARDELKKTQDDVKAANDCLLYEVAKAERTHARDAVAGILKRAYVAWGRSTLAHHGFGISFPGFIEKVFDGLRISEADQNNLRMELEREYGA